MRFAAAVTATGLISWLLLEMAKMLMAPIIAWVMGLLATALTIALAVGGVGLAIGLGVYFYRRSKQASAEV